ncbi:MAG: exonuclease domain-containing protein [Lachnospiraceae bacterium]|nr:exonuclease domain-containing protein [Lachnospiraceae bacterium]
MNYIVFDLEWNQSPGGKNFEVEGLPFEIIEIGAVKLDEHRQIVDEFWHLVKPVVYHRMSRAVREVTGISNTKLKQGELFTEVYEKFTEWCGEEPVFCTWGPSDLTELQRNAAFHHLKMDFSYPLFYYDVQKLFSLSCEDGRSRKSLKYAVEYLKLEETEGYHRAMSDALYTAKVMEKIDFERVRSKISVDYYRVPRGRKEEIHLVFDTYAKDVSMSYQTRDELMKDRKLFSTKCYICGKNAKRKIRWFSDNSRACYSVSFCPEHGWLKGKIRIRKSMDGRYFGIKTLKLIGDSEMEAIREKKRSIQERRRNHRHEERQG